MKKDKQDNQQRSISSFNIVAIAASAGGLKAINTVLFNLPAELTARKARLWLLMMETLMEEKP